MALRTPPATPPPSGRYSRLALAASLIAAVTLGACADRRDGDGANPAESVPKATSTTPKANAKTANEPKKPRSPQARILPRSNRREGSTMVVATVAGRRVALVADQDTDHILVVDPSSHQVLSSLFVGGDPAQILVAKDGRAYIAIRDRNTVLVAEPDPELAIPTLKVVDDFPTATEPVALAVSPDGKTLVVTSAWGRTLTAFDLERRDLKFQTKLDREPRGVTITSDGRFALVTHVVGARMTRIDLQQPAQTAALKLDGKDFTSVVFRGRPHFRRRPPHPPRPPRNLLDPMFRSVKGPPLGHRGRRFRTAPQTVTHQRTSTQGFAITTDDSDTFTPIVLIHRGNPVVVSAGYGSRGTADAFPIQQPGIARVDRSGDVTIRVANQTFDAAGSRHDFRGIGRERCMLPRAIDIDRDQGVSYVACLDKSRVLAYRNDAADDAPGLNRTQVAKYEVPAGPTGLFADSAAREVLVWSQFDRKLTTLPVAFASATAKGGKVEPIRPIRTTALPHPVDSEAPNKVLSAAADRGRRIFHGSNGTTDISKDGRVCASCHPDGREDGLTWPSPNGPRQTPMLAGRLDQRTAPFGWQGDANTIEEHLNQTFKRLGGKGVKGRDLQDLLAYLQEMSPPPQSSGNAGSDPTMVARGKELFHSSDVGCDTCHTDKGFGSDGKQHDVGGNAKVETPSLRFVSGTGPYFHDGRYATLGELLRATQGKMGWAAHLPSKDLDAIEAYLNTL